MSTSADILFQTLSCIGMITLNRPQALNALTANMCEGIAQHLAQWQQEDEIQAIVIRGNGPKAFCAGGDIRAIYQHRAGDLSQAKAFFWTEYNMNQAIFACKKPYIALLHGITMGGGVGVSLPGSHRIATPNLIFAMPETGIGLFPDVGASYFLSRLPEGVGLYLALSGQRMDAADALHYGLIDAIVAPTQLTKLPDLLLAMPSITADQIEALLQQVGMPAPASALASQQAQIQQHFCANSLEQIIDSLQQDDHPWAQQALQALLRASPISLAVTFEQLRLAAQLDFYQVIQMDFDLVQSFLQGSDFFEGVRAAVIDKDRTPHWQPDQLRFVTAESVASYFQHKQRCLTRVETNQ